MPLVNERSSPSELLPSHPPPWVRVLDVSSLVMIGITLVLVAGDGVRLDFGLFRVSITSAPRAAGWAVILILVRHALYRSPALSTRVVGWARSLVSRADIGFVARLVLATRVPPVLIGLLAVATMGLGEEARPGAYENPWLNLPARWDAMWYWDIAAFGYQWDGDWTRQQNVVFFPAFPLASHVAARLLGIHVLWAGWLVAVASFACAMFLYMRLARMFVDAKTASDSAWLLCTYPFAIYFSAGYSEGPFLLAMCGLLLSAHQERFGRAAAWGVVAGLARPNGWLLSLPLAVLIFQQPWPTRQGDWLRRGAAVAAPVAGVLLFTFYLHLKFNDGFAWVRGQAAWGRTFRGLHLLAADRVDYVLEYGLTSYLTIFPIDALNTGAALLALALIVPVARRLGLAYGVLVAAFVLPPLLVGGTLSMGRLTSVLFPLFIWLATILSPERRVAVMVAFAALQGFAATLFFTWRPLF
jgi:hypothetical protein